MQTNIISLFPLINVGPAPQMALTFAPFVNYIKKAKAKANLQQNHFFEYLITKFEQHPEMLKEISPEKVHRYKDLLQLIYHTLTPVIETEEKQYWAICMPGAPQIFYSTNAFYDLLADKTTGNVRENFLKENEPDIQNLNLEILYSMIIAKCYDATCTFDIELIKSVMDDNTGIMRHYKIVPDLRFIEVHPLKPLPELDLSLFKEAQRNKKELLKKAQEVLPADMFKFEGFGITSAVDVTATYALERIKEILLSHSSVDEENYYSRFAMSLKSLVGSKDVEFGLLPFLKVNSHLVVKEDACRNSILVKNAIQFDRMNEVHTFLSEDYMKNPTLCFSADIETDEENKDRYIKILKGSAVNAYALSPVFFNNVLVGAIEIYSYKKGLLDEMLLAKADTAMPLLAQLLKNTVDAFGEQLDQIMKEKFTAIQPSVQWKFNEAAWHYLEHEGQPGYQPEMEDIIFEHVYPLYGAVDIRNSTIERNAALLRDLQVQFGVMLHVLNKLKEKSGFGLLSEKIFSCQKWLDRVSAGTNFNQEMKLNEFLDNDITPFLQQFTADQPALAEIAQEYFDCTDETNGAAYSNRRQLEFSMNTVIAAVNKYFDMLKDQIQEHYPCYFEKFRTDGVEYDIYIGQSITPDKPYSDIYLKNLRLMQLTSMAAIARYSHSLLPQLSKPVETTQLIFIHSHPIEIRFRKDEKRFDVEGAYNIRYHIVKKRIDKVRIKETKERLTQPHKIAFVYFNQKEADEYISYIKYLQASEILKNDLEQLELEELQGVSGLKALRVSVDI